MAQKRFMKNVVIISVASALMTLFTYFFVEHHLDIPDRIQHERSALLGNPTNIAEQINPANHINVATTTTQLKPQADAQVTTTTSAKLDGQQVYQNTCVTCHGAGIAGAPKVGDASQWVKRIAKGRDALYASATNGLQGSAGVMPAKGGNVALSVAEVEAAVDYIVAQLK